jgi:hypothetical protein
MKWVSTSFTIYFSYLRNQYPFRSTKEGGTTDASIACVPAAQNTDQGSYMRIWFAEHGYLPGRNVGKTFGVKVVGIDCETVVSVGPQHNKRNTITGYGYNGDLVHCICVLSSLILLVKSHGSAWIDVR